MTTTIPTRHAADPQAPALLFACRWCSLLGAERAGRERMRLPAAFRLIPVECAGAVSLDLVLRAFADGFHGVAVMGCHLGGCRHNEANRNAHARLGMFAAALDAVGVRSERLLVSWGAAHEAGQFTAQVTRFLHDLDALRHSPDIPLLRGALAAESSGADFSGEVRP